MKRSEEIAMLVDAIETDPDASASKNDIYRVQTLHAQALVDEDPTHLRAQQIVAWTKEHRPDLLTQ